MKSLALSFAIALIPSAGAWLISDAFYAAGIWPLGAILRIVAWAWLLYGLYGAYLNYRRQTLLREASQRYRESADRVERTAIQESMPIIPPTPTPEDAMPDSRTVAFFRLLATVPTVVTEPNPEHAIAVRMAVARIVLASGRSLGLQRADKDIAEALRNLGDESLPLTERAITASLHALALSARWLVAYGFASGFLKAKDPREQVRRYAQTIGIVTQGQANASDTLGLSLEAKTAWFDANVERHVGTIEAEIAETLAAYDAFFEKEPHEYMAALEVFHLGIVRALEGVRSVPLTEWMRPESKAMLAAQLETLPTARTRPPGIARALRAGGWRMAFDECLELALGLPDEEVDKLLTACAELTVTL